MTEIRGHQDGLGRVPIVLNPDRRPILVIVIDTEEEFDWDEGFDRRATSVKALGNIGLAQEVFDEFRLRPTFMVDYPVACQPDGVDPIKELVDDGRAELGAHLHPWVSPPLEEEVCPQNSFAGNLPLTLETAKIERLIDQIETSFGRRPVIYKAGRYGFGPNTGSILEQLGFEVDLSFCPAFDFSADGGPDYLLEDCAPFWFGEHRRLLELPATGAFVGLSGRQAGPLYRWMTRPGLQWARLPGIASRLHLVDRLHLSPEGFQLQELGRLTDSLLRRGIRLFVFSFHSPSLKPGCTPYVRTDRDLSMFIDNCRYFFEYFLTDLGGVNLTPLEVKREFELETGGSSS